MKTISAMRYKIKLIDQKIDNEIKELKEMISRQQFSLMSIEDRVQYRLNRKEYVQSRP